MVDEVIKELWQIKDDIANEYGCDIEAFVAHLRYRPRPEGQVAVDLSAKVALSSGVSSTAPCQPQD